MTGQLREMKKVSERVMTLKLVQTQPLLVDPRQSFSHFLTEFGVSREIPSAVRNDSLKEAYYTHYIRWRMPLAKTQENTASRFPEGNVCKRVGNVHTVN